MKDINHPALLQEWKLNIDSAAYEKQIYDNVYKPSEKNILVIMIETCTIQPQ